MIKNIIRLAILISGSGTTAESIIKAYQEKRLTGVMPTIVVSSRPDAAGLTKAQRLGVKTIVIDPHDFKTEKAFANALLNLLRKNSIDIISQNGWLPKTPQMIVNKYKGKIINQHPGPLDPSGSCDFGGVGMYGARVVGSRVIYSYLTASDFWTEATTHFVTNKYDKGRLIKVSKMAYPKMSKKLTLSDIQNNAQIYISKIKKLQKLLLPLEHKCVITTLQMFSHGNKVAGFNRRQTLIPKEKEKFVFQARQLAIKLFPHG